MEYTIKIYEGKYDYGYIKGRIEDFYWYALVHTEPLNHGINKKCIDENYGRVTRLCVYKYVNNLKDFSVGRKIYADYKRHWGILNEEYIHMIECLVMYLERRFSMSIIK